MNRLSTEKRTRVIAALVEGTSINATCRMTGVAKHTVLNLLRDMGCAAAAYHHRHVRNLRVRRLQCDEIWSFVAAKQKNVTSVVQAREPMAGDVWTWVAMDADTKLACTWVVGSRDSHTARVFVQELKSRLANRVQLTSDHLRHDFHAIAEYFHDGVETRRLQGFAVLQPGKAELTCGTGPHAVLGLKPRSRSANPVRSTSTRRSSNGRT